MPLATGIDCSLAVVQVVEMQIGRLWRRLLQAFKILTATVVRQQVFLAKTQPRQGQHHTKTVLYLCRPIVAKQPKV